MRMSDITRIAMWSGPRNISTAMMRAFENRSDCAVIDEPFYAHYLLMTDLDHPGKSEILKAHEANWQKVAEQITGPGPGGVRVIYQKHMAHHMLRSIGHGWFGELVHGFLIREPRHMVASYAQKREVVTPSDLGVDLQKSLYEEISDKFGQDPPVLLADDVLKNPKVVLGRLCLSLGIPFDEAMLSWPQGSRGSDGVWAKHWYEAVEASTGFKPYEEKDIHLSDELEAVAAACQPAFDWLHERRLQP
jgi:hypothetical protein